MNRLIKMFKFSVSIDRSIYPHIYINVFQDSVVAQQDMDHLLETIPNKSVISATCNSIYNCIICLYHNTTSDDLRLAKV